jgi:flagellar biosynthetic protein FliQ
MSTDQAIELARNALLLALVLAAPVLVAALIIGLVTSALQTVTQLHDQTLSFVPRLVVVLLVALATLPWGLEMLVDFSRELFRAIPSNL